MSKVGKISGFPEWLPEQRIVEDRIIRTIRKVYESFGFVGLETSSAEHLSTLSAKGVIDKEIYALKRAKDEGESEAELGLRFDLSVPLARYVAQNFSDLTFPFKRCQCQKVWRGDRPQKGRFREFYQFDIDTIAQEELPLSCDAEILTAYVSALTAVQAGTFTVKLSNRKVMLGFFESLGLDRAQAESARIAVDKIQKIGADGVRRELVGTAQVTTAVADAIVEFAAIKGPARDAAAVFARVKGGSAQFDLGVSELNAVLKLVDADALPALEIDLSLARGLDYYTGLVFEVYFTDYPDFGSAGGGGRYDDLASQFINKKLPGVGASIGLTRLMDLIFTHEIVKPKGASPSHVLITVLSEDQRPACNQVAKRIRDAGLNAEVYFKSPKLGKQIDYAAAKGVPYVLFLSADSSTVEVKDINSKQQQQVTDLDAWCRATLQVVAQ